MIISPSLFGYLTFTPASLSLESALPILSCARLHAIWTSSSKLIRLIITACAIFVACVTPFAGKLKPFPPASLVLSRIDYCNYFYYSLALHHNHRLQLIQITLTRAVSRTSIYSRMTRFLHKRQQKLSSEFDIK